MTKLYPFYSINRKRKESVVSKQHDSAKYKGPESDRHDKRGSVKEVKKTVVDSQNQPMYGRRLEKVLGKDGLWSWHEPAIEIADRIRQLKADVPEMTQQDIAEEIGCTRSTVSKALKV